MQFTATYAIAVYSWLSKVSSEIQIFNFGFLSVEMYVCVYIYICIHTHTHTHTHIYIYIYIYKDKGKVFPLQARLWPRGWVEV